MGLTTADEHGRPWDFTHAERRQAARQRLQRDTPWLLVGSPMCKAFSVLQQWNRRRCGEDGNRGRLVDALMHLDSCVEL